MFFLGVPFGTFGTCIASKHVGKPFEFYDFAQFFGNIVTRAQITHFDCFCAKIDFKS